MSTQSWASVRSGRDAQFTTPFDTLVRTAFAPVAVRTVPSGRPVPAAEVVRDGDDALVRLDLPGVDVAADVTVEVDGERLVVRGERKDIREESQRGRGLREVRYGTFRRVFTLPTSVGADAVSATYDAGVLTVRVAGAHATTPARRIEVTTAAPVAVSASGTEGSDSSTATEAPSAE
ncbi:Hsp20/alpha crystallin family protein [Kineococcus rubinsiae]|uniref:Hsp20/alpha crystallin family protein n=1 Tax=Kineococcus rubinsiae TaxID=2609562 RepID=UPI0014304EC1|nr:Hsp20/alpha crystallin family protein [Kineococcus rubinsiae]